MKNNPGLQAVSDIGQVDRVTEKIGILRQPGHNIEKGDASRCRVALEHAVLEIRQTPDVGVAQRPQPGVQLLIDVPVPAWRQPQAILAQPLERGKHKLGANGIQTASDRIEVSNNSSLRVRNRVAQA